jgi:hypothetical protein
VVELVVGIDTSKASGKRSRGKRYVGVVFGDKSGLSRFVRDVESCLLTMKCNASSVHWADLHGPVRGRLFSRFCRAFPDYSLRALVFPVVPAGDKREAYLRSCPICIGLGLGRAIGVARGLVVIVSDSDFDGLVPKSNPWSRGSTIVFLEELVSGLGSALAGKPFRAVGNGKSVELGLDGVRIVARVGSRSDDEVQAADLALGLFSFGKSRGVRVRNVDEQPPIRG